MTIAQATDRLVQRLREHANYRGEVEITGAGQVRILHPKDDVCLSFLPTRDGWQWETHNNHTRFSVGLFMGRADFMAVIAKFDAGQI